MQSKYRRQPSNTTHVVGEQAKTALAQRLEDAWLNDVGPQAQVTQQRRQVPDVEEVVTVPLSRAKIPPVPSALGPLQTLLDDEHISEISILGPNRIYVKRHGIMQEASNHFTDNTHLSLVVEHLLQQTEAYPCNSHPNHRPSLIEKYLADGTHVTITLPPVSLLGPTVTFRKCDKKRFSLAHLVASGMLSEAMADFLKTCIQTRRNMLIAGTNDAGKTTLLNALCTTLPTQERIVTIENVAELHFNQGHVIPLLSSFTDSDTSEYTTTRTLLAHALRMQPARLILGECSGKEAAALLQAMYSGQNGTLTTLYAHSVRDCLTRFETLCLLDNKHVTVEVLREMIASVLHTIIFLSKYHDGSRNVTNIVEVQGVERGNIKIQSLFHQTL